MSIDPGRVTGLPSHRFPTYISSEHGDWALYPRLQLLKYQKKLLMK